MENSQDSGIEMPQEVTVGNPQENIVEKPVGEKKLELGPSALKNLNATRKWSTFLAVVGFIFLGLLIVMGLATSTFLTAFKTKEVNLGIPESLMTVFVIIIALIYFFPVFFLLRFSSCSRDAVQNLDRKKLDKAFRNLRIFFTYIGILVLIVLSIYLTILIAAGSSLAFLNGA
jgi:magnesium-transporting ATPase (P-type)